MRKALIMLAVLAGVVLVAGAVNNSVAFDVDYVAGTAASVSLFWTSVVVAALVVVAGIAAAWLALSTVSERRRKLEADLQSTYERLREAEALVVRAQRDAVEAKAAAEAAAEAQAAALAAAQAELEAQTTIAAADEAATVVDDAAVTVAAGETPADEGAQTGAAEGADEKPSADAGEPPSEDAGRTAVTAVPGAGSESSEEPAPAGDDPGDGPGG